MAAVTERGLNRATLQRQLLLRRERLDPAEAVRRIVAIQAQEPASAAIALWSRVEGLRAEDVDAAFRAGAIVKATLMRMTIHAVHAGDHPDVHDAMRAALRAGRLGDPRYLVTGLSPEDAVAVEDAVVEFAAEPRAREEIEAFLGDRVTDPSRLWWALRSMAPLVHAPTGGPWSFTARRFVSLGPPRHGVATAIAIGRLIRRFLDGFGPATIADLAQFTRLPRRALRDGLPHAGDLVEVAGPGRSVLHDVAGAPPIPDESTRAPARLLPMWDSTLFAYADRHRILPPDLRPHVIRTNGDTLPTVLVDGFVAGVWRPVEGGIEVTALHPIPSAAWSELADEAASLVRFLADREPLVYRRYRRWWERLPDPVERRILPG